MGRAAATIHATTTILAMAIKLFIRNQNQKAPKYERRLNEGNISIDVFDVASLPETSCIDRKYIYIYVFLRWWQWIKDPLPHDHDDDVDKRHDNIIINNTRIVNEMTRQMFNNLNKLVKVKMNIILTIIMNMERKKRKRDYTFVSVPKKAQNIYYHIT